LPDTFPLQKQIRGGIKKIRADIAVLVRQLSGVDGLVIQHFLARQFDLVAFAFVIDQGAVKVGFNRNVLEVFGSSGSTPLFSTKGLTIPPGRLAVVNADDVLPFDGDLHAHFQRALELDNEGAFHPLRERDVAADALRLNGLDFFGTPPRRVEHLFDDFVGGLGGGGQRQEQE